MKKPMMSKGDGKSKAERPQGKPKGRASGVNKPVTKAAIPQVDMHTTYGKPSQTQKMS